MIKSKLKLKYINFYLRYANGKYDSFKVNKAVRDNLSQIQSEDYTLLTGYPKSGNTWLRFLICNYYSIIREGRESTMTYDELNSTYQPLAIEHEKLYSKDDLGIANMARTHWGYADQMKEIPRILYVHRYPLDVLTSYYDFFIVKRKGVEIKQSIDDFVIEHLPKYMLYHQKYLRQENVFALTYESLKKDPASTLRNVLCYMQNNSEVDDEAILKSIELSSFISLKKMGRESGQLYGNAPKGKFTGEFTRKGVAGGYKEELKASTIAWATKAIKKSNLFND